MSDRDEYWKRHLEIGRLVEAIEDDEWDVPVELRLTVSLKGRS